jgi:1-deoxy-D-xylulose 5-phosphate reductoisomerase
MNQSRIAEKVVQQIKVSLKTPKRTEIKFFDLLTTYVLALQFIESDSSRYMCLKSLQHLLCEIINPTAEFKQTNMD